ncbi:MAG: GDP-L-fucose synthase [Patescibacteria group bacterium]
MDTHSKIYVAGHAGLMGHALLYSLQKHGFHNIITQSHTELDLTRQDAVASFFAKERPEYVFLLAAKVGGIFANNTLPAEFIYQNLAIASNVIHQSYLAGVKKLLFFGSACIYPRECPQPMKEDYLLSGPLEPTNEPYAIAKIAGIKLCQSYNRQYGTNFIAIMPINLYGIHDNFHPLYSHVIPGLMRKFHEAKKQNAPTVTLWGTGSAVREFLYSEDCAEACLMLMNTFDPTKDQNERGEIFFNVGTGEGLTIRTLAELMTKVTGYTGTITWDHSKPDGMPKKVLDVSRIHALGWRHTIPLEEGLKRMYEWYQHSIV